MNEIMAFDDSRFYRDSSQWGKSWTPDDDIPRNQGGGGGLRAPTGRSIVITLIVINVAIAFLDLFTPKMLPETSGKPDSSSTITSLDAQDTEAVSKKVKPQKSNQPIAHWLSRFMGLSLQDVASPWMLFRLMSYGFAHASIDGSSTALLHVGFNMLVLFMLGRPVESRLGWYEFLRFYLVAIVVAGIVFLLVDFLLVTQSRHVVGASGAVTAVVILFVLMYPNETLLLMGVVPVKAWILGVAVIVMDLFNALSPESTTAVDAHFAGAAFGAAYFYYKWNLRWMRIEKIGALFRSKPKLKVHSVGPDAKLQSQADEILRKINEQGEQSLTSKERRILKNYSNKIRETRDD